MSVERQIRPTSLAWSNPLAWWWGLLTLVSGTNIAVWFLLYEQLHAPLIDRLDRTSGIELMLMLCAAYVFGCAFRSLLPRADIQRICLFDTWLSSVMVGRSVATFAELCFVAQWAILLHGLGTMAGADTTLNTAWIAMALIVVAECVSWYGVVTANYLGSAIENSIWGIAFAAIGIGLGRLLPDFDGPMRVGLAVAILGIALYLTFLAAIDIPMYVRRSRSKVGDGRKLLLRPLEGLYDVCTRWVVTHDVAAWRNEIPWMSLYFSAAVWASLALCVFYSLEDHLARCGTEGTVASCLAERIGSSRHPSNPPWTRAFNLSRADTGSSDSDIVVK